MSNMPTPMRAQRDLFEFIRWRHGQSTPGAVQRTVERDDPHAEFQTIGELTGRTAADRRDAARLNAFAADPRGRARYELKEEDGDVGGVVFLERDGDRVRVRVEAGPATIQGEGDFVNPPGVREVELRNLQFERLGIPASRVDSAPTSIRLRTSQGNGHIYYVLDRPMSVSTGFGDLRRRMYHRPAGSYRLNPESTAEQDRRRR